jgi:hypothetical protein
MNHPSWEPSEPSLRGLSLCCRALCCQAQTNRPNVSGCQLLAGDLVELLDLAPACRKDL